MSTLIRPIAEVQPLADTDPLGTAIVVVFGNVDLHRSMIWERLAAEEQIKAICDTEGSLIQLRCGRMPSAPRPRAANRAAAHGR